jgi:RNA polymerase sigma-70 factor, ECF subfamily
LNRASDAQEIHQFYQTHVSMVRKLVLHLAGPGADVDDIVQEVFLVAWRKRGLLGTLESQKAWLRSVAIREVGAARRRARFRRWLGLEPADEPSDARTPETAYQSREASALVHELLSTLSEKKRTVFILYELQGLSGEEIAESVGCPLKTVWTRLHHARREFNARLAEAKARESGLRAQNGGLS